MSQHSGIQYCDGTVNPTSGCDGCELWNDKERICYAGNLHESRMALSLPQLYAPKFNEVRLCPGRMAKAAAWSDLRGKDRADKPWLNGRPRTIFISDMADALSKDVPFEYLKSEIIDNVTSTKGRRHIWMWLTKQARRMEGFSGWLKEQGINWPDNLWPGTSVTGPKTLGRIIALLGVGNKSTIRWVSAEPLSEGIDLTRIKLNRPRREHTRQHVMASAKDWCEKNDVDPLLYEHQDAGSLSPATTELNVLAGETMNELGIVFGGARRVKMVMIGGASAQDDKEPWLFELKWAYDLISQCDRYGAAAFLKQLGSRVHFSGTQGGYGNGPSNVWPKGTEKVDIGGAWRLLLKDSHGGDWSEWPQDLRVRNFPSLAPAAAKA